ncbi:capsid assembly scaffolding protein Gp46 family protein [Agathobacter sp. LCP21S3_B2]|uniref:capsid assembly scaffolding protein Gp46 family protein n=1 Tax=Agathobacter sp. LCP21S3_B2 TaxID=3438734 RepID=UPI003F8F7BD5
MELNIEGLTQEQIEAVQRIIQSETDKVRTKYSSELKTVNDELAQYKPKQKSDSELALEQRIANLEAKEKELANKERAMTIADKLKAKGLPSELAQYLNVGEDIDGSIYKVGDALGNYFLGQVSNPTGNHSTNKGITKADFAKMSYSERAKLFQENNELYKALSK